MSDRNTKSISLKITRSQASDPNSSPELLTQLANSEDAIVRQNVTANPNTPKETLFILVDEFPETFLSNPIVPLLELEDPQLDFLLEISDKTWIKLLEVPLKNNKDRQQLVFPQSWLRKKLIDGYSYETISISTLIQNHPNLWFSTLEKFLISRGINDKKFDMDCYLIDFIDEYVSLISNPPKSLLETWANPSYGMNWRCMVALLRKTPVDLLEKLAGDKNLGILVCVAANLNTPEPIFRAVMDRLVQEEATEDESYVYNSVLGDEAWDYLATHPNTPQAYLKKMMREGALNASIMNFLIHTQKFTLLDLEQMASDENEYVRASVAATPNIRTEILERLANDTDKWVRHRIVNNPNSPQSILQKLASDTDESVRASVAEHPNTSGAILQSLENDTDYWTRYKVAKNPNTSTPILQSLASDEHKSVRGSVAANPNTPKSILKRLASDTDSSVRQGVAANPNIPKSILQKLTSDEDKNVRASVAENPNTPQSILGVAESRYETIRNRNISKFEVMN